MEKKIVIKKTAATPAGTKYLDIAVNEGGIASPLTFSEMPNGQLQASVDGEKIGKVIEMTKADLPNIYTAFVTGADKDKKEFSAVITCDDSAEESSDFKSSIEEASKASEIEEDEIVEMVKVMENNRVHPSIIKEALKAFRKYDKPFHVPSAIYEDARGEKEESIMNEVLLASLTRSALIFAGEKSTGKNVCAETCAYVLGRPYYRINFERDMLLEDIFGSKTTDNSAADALDLELAKAKLTVDLTNGPISDIELERAAEFELLKAKSACIRLVQTTSDIVRWAKEGGVMMFDELNMADANTLQVCMNSTADSEKVLIVPGVGEIELNPDCVLLGGMNPGYAGTFELNQATKSRCGVINFEYPKSIEPQLRANFGKTSIPDRYYKACDLLYKDFKAATEQGRCSATCLNIRGFVNALKGIERFPEATTLKSQIDVFVVSGCEQEERTLLNTMVADKIDM